MYDLSLHVRRLDIFGVLNAFIYALEELVNCQGWVNWLVHLLIFDFEVRGHNFPVSIDNMLKEIVEL